MSSVEESSVIRRILIVDDNPAIHEDFRKVLARTAPRRSDARLDAELFGGTVPIVENGDFVIDSALQGQEACAKVRAAVVSGEPYAVAFVDIRMPPGWDGIETITKLRELDPSLQFVICTAYSDYSWIEIQRQFGPGDNLLVLNKPFDLIEVRQLAHALSQKWLLAQEVDRQIGALDAAVACRTKELREANAQLKAEIAERARAETALLQSQKMEAIGQLAAGIAHDFNNILTVVRGHTSMMLERPHLDAEIGASLREVSEAAERATSLAGQLLAFSRKQRLKPRPFDVNETVERLHSLLHRVLGENIKIQIECALNLPTLVADEPQIEQVLINLVVNARDAMPQGGTLDITTKLLHLGASELLSYPEAPPGEFIVITVSDTGIGMTNEVLRHLFEPFFTTKEKGKGTGLGLATAYGIVKQHRGWIEVSSELGRGSKLQVVLPRGDATTPLEEALPGPAPGRLPGSETVLVVEDDATVRSILCGMLKYDGYQVFEAACGDDALVVWRDRHRDIDLVVTDLIMPGTVDGRSLAVRLREDRPDLRLILTTGYVDKAIDEDEITGSGLMLLRKPYTADEFLITVRQSLDNSSGQDA
jgi:two-component system NtrC family sensor kinase